MSSSLETFKDTWNPINSHTEIRTLFQDSDILHRAKDFHPTVSTLRKLFLVHGTADDNVHMQHSMVLAKELVKEGVLFKQQVNVQGRISYSKPPYQVIASVIWTTVQLIVYCDRFRKNS